MRIKKKYLTEVFRKFLNEQESEENKTIDSVKLEKKKEDNEKIHKKILNVEDPEQALVQFAAFLQTNDKDEDLKTILYKSPDAIQTLGIQQKEYTYDDFKKFGAKVKAADNAIKLKQGVS